MTDKETEAQAWQKGVGAPGKHFQVIAAVTVTDDPAREETAGRADGQAPAWEPEPLPTRETPECLEVSVVVGQATGEE